jgi:hypothetical protein
LALVAVVAIGWPKSDNYANDRYRASSAPKDFPAGMKAALAWFNVADPHDSRIAIVGGRPGFKQYIFYGDDLSNRVQYVAHHGPHGAYTPIASEAAQNGDAPPSALRTQCDEWITALSDGGYRYAVIGPDQRTQSKPPVEATWTVAAGGTRTETTDDVSVFRLGSPLSAAACRRAGYRVNQGAIAAGSGSAAPQ